MFNTMIAFATDDSGATAIEYGLIAALIAVAAITTLESLSTSLNDMFKLVSSKLDKARPRS